MCSLKSEKGCRWNMMFNLGLNTRCISLGAITNYHKLDSLKNKHLLLTVLEAWKSKIKVPAHSVSDEDTLPGFHMAFFSFLLTWWRAGRKSKLSHLFYKDPILEGFTLIINYYSKGPTSNITLGLGFQLIKFEATHFSS